MPIITIFGGTFGDDDGIARSVAEKLNCRYVGRDILVDAARRCEVAEAKLDEVLEREPHWWTRWQENLRPYRTALQAAMSHAAVGDNLVYLGHVGQALLPGIRHVLRVLLTAPLEFRVERVRERQAVSAAAARHYLEQVEKARTQRLIDMFGNDSLDPGQYALVLNMAQISSVGAQAVIVHAAKLAEYQPTAESRQALENLALSKLAEAHLLTFPRFSNLDINVKANAGEIILTGVIPPALTRNEILREVETLPGVRRVLADLVTISSQGSRPR